MASFNKVILVGNLTRDPELRVTGTGLSICKIGLAVNRSYTSKDGESKDETTYVDVDAFGKQAEILGKYMQKGRPLMVEGRLKLDQWESNDGQKRSKLGVVLESCEIIGGRDDNTSRSSSTSESNSQDNSNNTQEESFDGDVPF
jgi:single-strand DNA-binding protein